MKILYLHLVKHSQLVLLLLLLQKKQYESVNALQFSASYDFER